MRGFAAAVVLGATFGLWLWLWRYVPISGDDFRASTNGGFGQYGAITLDQWLSAVAYDYTQWNGRISDALVKAQLSLGYGSWRITSPLLLTLVSWVSWLYVRAVAKRSGSGTWSASPSIDLAALVVACALPLAMVGSNAFMGPTTFFFNAAVIGYGTGFLLSLGVVALLLGPVMTAHGGAGRAVWLVGTSAMACLLGVVNESASLGLLATLFVLLLLPSFRRIRASVAVVLGAAVVGFTIFFFSPGRMLRQELMEEDQASLLIRVGRGFVHLLMTSPAITIAALLTSIAVIASFTRVRTLISVLVASVAAVGVLVAFLGVWLSYSGADLASWPSLLSSPRRLALVGGVLALACIGYLLTVTHPRIRTVLLITTPFAVGAALPSLILGLYTGRPWVFTLWMVVLQALALLLCPLPQKDSRRTFIPAGFLLLAAVVLGVRGAAISNAELSAVNDLRGSSEKMLLEYDTLADPPKKIVFPTRGEYPDDRWARLGLTSFWDSEEFYEWYGIPSDLEIVWGTDKD